MNKTLKLTAVSVFSIFLLSACGKKYVCECTSNADPTLNKTLSAYTSLSKKDAKKDCDDKMKQPMSYFKDSIAVINDSIDFDCRLK